MLGTGLIPAFAGSGQGDGECQFGAAADLD